MIKTFSQYFNETSKASSRGGPGHAPPQKDIYLLINIFILLGTKLL